MLKMRFKEEMKGIFKRFDLRSRSEKLKIKYVLWGVLFLNLMLLIAKNFLWLYTHLDSLKLEASNSLISTIYCVLALFSYYIIYNPKRESSSHGYGRIEYVATLLMAILVAANGAFYFVKSVTRYPFPSSVIFHWEILALLLAVATIKIVLGIFTKKLVKTLRTVAVRFIANMMITEGVMGIFVAFSYGITPFVPFSIDAIVTTIVGIIFMFIGLIYTIILGKIIVVRDPRVSTLTQITNVVKQNERVVGVGKLVIHDYGSQQKEATLEVIYDFAFAGDVYDTNVELENKLYDELGIKVKIIPIREKVYTKKDDVTLGVPVIESGFSVKEAQTDSEVNVTETILEAEKQSFAEESEKADN